MHKISVVEKYQSILYKKIGIDFFTKKTELYTEEDLNKISLKIAESIIHFYPKSYPYPHFPKEIIDSYKKNGKLSESQFKKCEKIDKILNNIYDKDCIEYRQGRLAFSCVQLAYNFYIKNSTYDTIQLSLLAVCTHVCTIGDNHLECNDMNKQIEIIKKIFSDFLKEKKAYLNDKT